MIPTANLFASLEDILWGKKFASRMIQEKNLKWMGGKFEKKHFHVYLIYMNIIYYMIKQK